MSQKGYLMDQKRAKNAWEKAKKEFSNLKYLLFSGIFLSGMGGYPPPLTENHCAQKSLAERGGIRNKGKKKYLTQQSKVQCYDWRHWHLFLLSRSCRWTALWPRESQKKWPRRWSGQCCWSAKHSPFLYFLWIIESILNQERPPSQLRALGQLT